MATDNLSTRIAGAAKKPIKRRTAAKKHTGTNKVTASPSLAKPGRPRKYKTPKEMQLAIDRFFGLMQKPTVCGLALELGFCTRQSLLDYEGYGKEFLDTIKKAKLRIERWYELNLLGNHAGGAIFALKNFDWTDKQERIHGVTDGLAELLKEISGNGSGLPIKQE